MKRILIMLCLFCPPAFAVDDISDEKLMAIKELLKVTNADANAEEFIAAFTQQMTSLLRARNPNLPQRAYTIVEQAVTETVIQEMAAGTLQAQIYPIYSRHFSLAELRELIEFNKSPLGQKANRLMPNLMKESMDAAQSWSEQVGPRISSRVLERFREEDISLQ